MATDFTNLHGIKKWRLPYLLLFAVTVLAICGIETLLLEIKYGYFSGGFLAVNILSTAPQIAGFLATSLVLDAFIVLAIWGILTPVLERTRLNATKTLALAGLLTPVFPFASDYVNYEMHTYFKDMLDLGLMWQMSEESPREMLSQWGGQLIYVAAAAVIGFCFLILVVNILYRISHNSRKAGWVFTLPALRTTWTAAGLLGIMGAAGLILATTSASPIAFGLNKKPSGSLMTKIVQFVTDFDRDGYGLLSQPHDSAYFNGAVHPYAVDIPGNGIDEDGLAGDHPLTNSLPQHQPDNSNEWRLKPNVLIILLESVRADMIQARMGEKEVVPFLNQLASEGASSAHAYSNYGSTVPSRAQLFGGKLLAHPGQTTLIDDFKKQGYSIAYFSGQDDSFGDSQPLIGYDKADIFYDARADKDKRYSASTSQGSLAVPCKLVNERVMAFLQKHDPARPLFLYVNYHDTHFPYHHAKLDNLLDVNLLSRSQIRPAARQGVWETYANAVANVDRAIGEMVQAWRQHLAGTAQIIIVTSDHGQSLFERGFLGHGYAVDEAQTRVPFILWGEAGTWVEPLGLADVRPQLLANLTRDGAGEIRRPRFIPDSSRLIIQYVGSFTRPRMLAWRTLNDVTIYDFFTDSTSVRGYGSEEAITQHAGLDRSLFPRVWEWESLSSATANGAVQYGPR